MACTGPCTGSPDPIYIRINGDYALCKKSGGIPWRPARDSASYASASRPNLKPATKKEKNRAPNADPEPANAITRGEKKQAHAGLAGTGGRSLCFFRGDKAFPMGPSNCRRTSRCRTIRRPALRRPALRGPTLRSPTLHSRTLRGPTIRSPTILRSRSRRSSPSCSCRNAAAR